MHLVFFRVGVWVCRPRVLVGAASIVLVACEPIATLPPIAVASCPITPGAPLLRVGDSLQLSATPLDAAGDRLRDVAVSWRSESPTVATVDASLGTVRGVSVGTGQITATCGSRALTVAVTVAARVVSRVELSPTTLSVTELDSARITATAFDDRGAAASMTRITWTSSDATVALIDTTGRVFAAAPGTATIAATAGTVSATASVRVAARPVGSITLSTNALLLPRFDAQPLSVTVRDASGRALPGRTPVWSSSAPAIATVSSVGVVTAISVGTSTITATIEGRSASATVTVIPPATVVRLDLAPSVTTVFAARTVAITGTPRDSTGRALANRIVQWSSSTPSIAAVSNGTVNAVAPGVAVITAVVEGVTAVATVTVLPMPVASLVIAPGTPTVSIGRTTTLTATARDSAGGVIAGRPVTWTSLTPSIATVSSAGVVSGIAEGAAFIRAEVAGVSATVAVPVTAPTVAAVQITPSSPNVPLGGTVSLQAIAYDSSGIAMAGRTFTWATTNGTIAAVSTAGVVTGVAVGSTSISATTGGRSAQVSASVRAIGSVTRVEIAPARTYLIPGESRTLSAIAYDANGFVVTGRPVTWTGSDATIATVSSGGDVRAVAAGPARVTAAVDGRLAIADLQVVPTYGQPVQSVRSGGYWDGFDSYTTCAVVRVNAAFCWGNNTSGQIGDGSTQRRDIPVRVAGALAFRTVEPGYGFTCGLATDGAAYCWGGNARGQLGDGTTSLRLTPTPVQGGRTFTQLTVGDQHVCALDVEGLAWCWGNNRTGQLGVGSAVSSSSVPLRVVTEVRFTSLLAMGRTFSGSLGAGGATCGISTDQRVFCWGVGTPDGTWELRYTPVDLSNGERFIRVLNGGWGTLGNYNWGVVCALHVDGAIWCALGSAYSEAYSWRRVAWQWSVSLENDGATNIVCGLSAERSASCWNTRTNTSGPYVLREQPPLLTGSSNGFVLGIDEAGRLWQWQLPNNSLLLDGPSLIVIPP